MERLLLHTCCAPCSVYCVESLRDEGIEPVSFWFNPNIHPYQEYKARRDTLIGYAGDIGLELLVLLLRLPPGGDRPLCRGARLYRILHHPAGQPLSGPRRHPPRGGASGRAVRRPLPVPGFPARLPAGTG